MESNYECFRLLRAKVKQSRNRPGLAQKVPGRLGSQISWHSARKGGEVSFTPRPPLPPGMFLVLIFTSGWVDPRAMERSERDMSLKNPVTPPGIDPGTVRLVAQRLNHYAIPGPSFKRQFLNKWKEQLQRIYYWTKKVSWENSLTYKILLLPSLKIEWQ
jgi:hypothetical protein